MEYYYSYPQEPQQKPKKQRASIGLAVFLCCIVLTTVIGLFAGLLISNGVNRTAALPEASAAVQATALPEASAATDEGGSALTTYRNVEMSYDGAYTRAQIVEKCAPSVVGIDITMDVSGGYYYGYGQGGAYEATGSGSGVILTADGYIATCAHVVSGAKTIQVTLNDETTYDATLVGTDSRNDLAIIKIEADGLTAAVFGDSDMLTVGEDVIAIGNPLGELRGTATSGIVSAVSRTVSVENVKMTLVQTDAAISPGNSGGGLFDANGCLIGIVNAKVASSEAEGLGFAIPVNSVVSEIDDLLNYGYITGRAALGVYTQNVTMRSSEYGFLFGQGATSCVQITDVIADSAAEAAALQAGDLILKVDDTEISSNSDLSACIAAYNAGDRATLTIQRNGQQLTVTVTFREYKPA